MQLEYFRADVGNFGDDLNRWIWSRFQPDLFDEDGSVRFLGIGTIIGLPLPEATQRVVVFSSGIGYRPPPGASALPHEYVAVRGPLTAKVLGLSADVAQGDGALLLPLLPEFAPLPEAQRSGTIFVPHWEKMDDQVLLAAARSAGLEVVDPRQDPETVIQRLRSASKVIADSMHAAIIADALGVPWVPVATSRNISSFKWIDWASSLGVPYEPTLLPQGTTQMALRSLLKRRVVGTQFTGSGKEAALANYRALAQRIAAPDFEKARYKGFHRVDRLVDLSKSTWLRPGVARLLSDVRSSGLKLAVCTTSGRETFEGLLLNAFGFEALDWFAAVVTREDVTAVKPDPAPYLATLERLGAPAEAAVVIEDSGRGVASARAAGIEAIAAPGLYTRGDDFADARLVLSDLGEPSEPFEVLAGDPGPFSYVSADALRLWHARGCGAEDAAA